MVRRPLRRTVAAAALASVVLLVAAFVPASPPPPDRRPNIPLTRPYVPAGWDRWLVKRQGDQSTAYYRYVLIDQGFPDYRGDGPDNYSTDVYAAAAVSFIRSAPPGRPFFLEVAPTAPHRPWTEAPRDTGALAGFPIAAPPALGEWDV